MLDVTGCAHLFGGEAALARDLVRRLGRAGLCRRASRSPIRSAARGRWRAIGEGQSIVPRGEDAERDRAPAPRGAAPRRRDRRRRWRRSASSASPMCSTARARRSRRASARRSCAASIRRSAATTSRSRRACRCRPRWPSSAFAEPIALERDVLGTIERLAAKLGARAGAARRRRAAVAGRAVPHRRQGVPHRGRHRRAAARCRRASATCSPTGSA